MTAPLSLNGKIVAAMRLIGSLNKDGKVQGGSFSYPYLSEAQVTAAVQHALCEVGLVLYLKSYEITSREPHAYPNKEGVMVHRGTLTVIRAAYELRDADSDAVLPIECPGEGLDMDDKSLGKALTDANKAMQQLLFRIAATNGTAQQDDNRQQQRRQDTRCQEPAERQQTEEDGKCELKDRIKTRARVLGFYGEDKQYNELMSEFWTAHGFSKGMGQMNAVELATVLAKMEAHEVTK